MLGELRGIIQSGTPSGYTSGWYTAKLTMGSPASVIGISIKGTALAAGQVVDVICCGADNKPEWGFIETSHDTGSMALQDGPGRLNVCAQAPAGVALAGLAFLGGNRECRFRPARVAQVQASSLIVVDQWNAETLILPVSSDLSPSDFLVNDVALISTSPRQEVIGWWQTVSSTEPYYFWASTSAFALPIATVAVRAIYLSNALPSGYGPGEAPHVPEGYIWRYSADMPTLSADRKTLTSLAWNVDAGTHKIGLYFYVKPYPTSIFPIRMTFGAIDTGYLARTDGIFSDDISIIDP